MDTLKDYLDRAEPGRIDDTRALEPLLATAWDSLSGSDEEGMAGHKLLGRMEDAEWRPPVLSFAIERHGGTVNGSTRGEIQRWSVNMDERTASCETRGFRQLSRTAMRVNTVPIAEELAGLISKGKTDPRLKWHGDDKVTVQIGTIFPANSGFKQTTEGRRKRLREGLEAILNSNGWRHRGRNVFEKEPADHK